MAFDVQRETALPESAKGKAEKTIARMSQLFSEAVFLETLCWGNSLATAHLQKASHRAEHTVRPQSQSGWAETLRVRPVLTRSVATSAVRER